MSGGRASLTERLDPWADYAAALESLHQEILRGDPRTIADVRTAATIMERTARTMPVPQRLHFDWLAGVLDAYLREHEQADGLLT